MQRFFTEKNFPLVIVSIPIYYFFIYPLFHYYVPAMLARIRIGSLLVTCSHCMYGVVDDLLVCNSLENSTCLFFHLQMFNISSNVGWWKLGSLTVHDVGFNLILITLIDLCVLNLHAHFVDC